MASVFKAAGAKVYSVVYTDQRGKRRKKKGYTDKRESEKLGMRLEDRARKIRDGSIDPKDESYGDHANRPLADHVADWHADLCHRGRTAKHADLSSDRVPALRGYNLRRHPGRSGRQAHDSRQCAAARGRIDRLIEPARLSIPVGSQSPGRLGCVPRFWPIARNVQSLPSPRPRICTVGLEKRPPP